MTLVVRTLLVVAATAQLAHADQHSATLNAGGELLFGGSSTSGGLRVHAGFGRSFGRGSVQPTVSIGGTLGYGSISVDAAGAPDGRAQFSRFDIGPELTLALRFANGGWVDKRLFVAGAVYVRRDDDGRSTSATAYRVGVGMNWLDGLLHARSSKSFSNDRSAQSVDLLAVLLPHQVELVWAHEDSLDRFGLALAWGL